MPHHLRFAANCSLLFTEVPLLERAAAARAAGFSAVEFWWPWPDQPVPPEAEVDAFVASIGDAGVRLIALNLFAGDVAGADCGVASIPGRSAQLAENLDVAMSIGERLQVGAFNAPYGNRVDGVTPARQDELATESLARAAAAASTIGATVLIEAVSGPKPYPLRTAADAVAVCERVSAVGATNIGFLADLYHLATNGEDLAAVVADHAERIAHVQIADAPGRGEPGSGSLDLDGPLTALERLGYDGWVALEYNPTGSTLDSLAWLPRDRRAG
jgi:hydroxypyruvate isomerase